jgi:hypothetical protein
MLLAVYPYEDFIDEEGVTVTSVLPFQTPGVYGPELDAPKANRFSGYSDASLCEKIFNIAMT